MSPLCTVTLFGSPDRHAVSSPLTGEDWEVLRFQAAERDRSDDVDDCVLFAETITHSDFHLRRDPRGKGASAAAETQLTRADVEVDAARCSHVGATISVRNKN